MLLVTYIRSFSHVFCKEAVQPSLLEIEDFSWVFDLSWVENLTSRWKTSNGSNVQQSWGNHATRELESVSGRFPKVKGRQQHLMIVDDFASSQLD